MLSLVLRGLVDIKFSLFTFDFYLNKLVQIETCG